jgi:Pyruvate/2-oxoacid:ferredoxin oxidoreductase gamma subunit
LPPPASAAARGEKITIIFLNNSNYGTTYSARGAVNNAVNFTRTKKALETAFQKQLAGEGFTFVEILSACPPNWHKSPIEALRWINEVLSNDIQAHYLPASEFGVELGFAIVASLVLLGAYLKLTGAVSLEMADAALEEMFGVKPNTVAIDREALRRGWQAMN